MKCNICKGGHRTRDHDNFEALKTAKIGTKEESFWTDVVKKTEIEIKSLEKMLTFNKAILVMANDKIDDETDIREEQKHNGNR